MDAENPGSNDPKLNNVFRLVPQRDPNEPTAEEMNARRADLVRELLTMAEAARRGDLTGIAFVTLHPDEKFGIGWRGDVPLPPMVGYLEFLQQQMIANAYLGGIEE